MSNGARAAVIFPVSVGSSDGVAAALLHEMHHYLVRGPRPAGMRGNVVAPEVVVLHRTASR